MTPILLTVLAITLLLSAFTLWRLRVLRQRHKALLATRARKRRFIHELSVGVDVQGADEDLKQFYR